MGNQTPYAGATLREIRSRQNLTQKAFAARLGVSLPYANQMENNQRPISSTVILALVQEFGFDVSELAVGDSERMVSDLREALADPVFQDTSTPIVDLRLVASNAPSLAKAFLKMHQTYRHATERLASLDEVLDSGNGQPAPSPWEEVRDFFHYCDNYIDAVDKAAENFAGANDSDAAISTALEDLGVSTRDSKDPSAVRSFDANRKILFLSAAAPSSTRRFQALHQIALLAHEDLLEATLDLARFHSNDARAIAKVGLANYFAGAAQMPYGTFIDAALDT